MQEPKTRFTGIFIPVEILEMPQLSFFDQMLLSWIDALYCEEKGGCFADNEHLAARLKNKPRTVSDSITKLKRLGLIAQVSFDGRVRVIKSLIHKYKDDVNNNFGTQTSRKLLGGLAEKSQSDQQKTASPHNKEESKIESKIQIHTSSCSPDGSVKSADASVFFFSENVKLSLEDYNSLTEEFGKDNVNKALKEMECFVKKRGCRPFSWAKRVPKWIEDWKKFDLPKGENYEQNLAYTETAIDSFKEFECIKFTKNKMMIDFPNGKDLSLNMCHDHFKECLYKYCQLPFDSDVDRIITDRINKMELNIK